jgi:glycosyltransferase involved in cell wall biosynthesis
LVERSFNPVLARGLRVLHVITSLRTGGAEAMLANLIQGASGAECESLVICLGADGPMGDRVRASGGTTLVLGFPSLRSAFFGAFHAWQTVRRWKPSIVQGWMYHGNLAAWMLRFFTNRSAKLVWNIRCTLTDIYDFPPLTRFVIRGCAVVSGAPALVIFNSRVAVAQHTASGFRCARSVVLSNGFDLARFAPNVDLRREVRARLGVDTESLLVGLIARYHPMKDFPNFLAAAIDLLREYPSTRMLLGGPGVDAENADLTLALREAGLLDRVDRIGEVLDVSKVLPALDVLCLSSAWGEAFPNIVGEAMACGVPCVATNVGDAGEILEGVGYVVPPRDPLSLAAALKVIAGLPKSAREALGLSGRARVQARYDIRVIVNEYLRAYTALSRE